jgi:hypothetical protein
VVGVRRMRSGVKRVNVRYGTVVCTGSIKYRDTLLDSRTYFLNRPERSSGSQDWMRFKADADAF